VALIGKCDGRREASFPGRKEVVKQKFRHLAFRIAIICGTTCVLTASTGLRAQERSTGTAFVVARNGYLLTCNHVVKDIAKVEVALGGKTYEASVLGRDEKGDLALMRIEADGLTSLPFADSNTVEVGEEVRAFGFPLSSILGDSVKVTRGTISGIDTKDALKVFQIDAAVNPGNSGGPLINGKGEVVGVVNAKLANVQVSNVGFCVPVNHAVPLLRDANVEFAVKGAEENLDGPALYKRVSSAIALVTVMGRPPIARPRPDGAIVEEAIPSKPIVTPNKPRKLLVFNLCQGLRHDSIAHWDKALEIMAKKTGAFSVVFSSDLDIFKGESLKEFDAVCLNNTTGLKFNPEKTPELCKSLMDFVKGGKGIIGIHAAIDSFYEWPEAQEMMGNKFTGHPWGGNGTWAIKIDEPDHPLMAAFKGKGFKINDEIYRTEPPLYSRGKQLVLMSLDMSDPTTRNVPGVQLGEDTGISWIKTWGNGRVFYCSLGHNDHLLWNPAILQHYLDGIQFAFGDYKVDTKPKDYR